MAEIIEENRMLNVEIKKVSSLEENVSLRHITYDVYVDGEYDTTFSDICDALDYKDAMEDM